MSSPASLLEYGKPEQRRRWRPFHIFFLPLLWLPAGIGSSIYYGDEYASLAITHMPAWPLLILQNRVEFGTLSYLAIFFNSALMLVAGLLMDVLRVPGTPGSSSRRCS